MPRPDHIPAEIWTMARQSGQRNGSYEQTLRTAEMLMARAEGRDERDEDKVVFWPGLTRREARVVRDALMGHDTVIDDDVSALFRLRSVFDNQAQARRELTGDME